MDSFYHYSYRRYNKQFFNEYRMVQRIDFLLNIEWCKGFFLQLFILCVVLFILYCVCLFVCLFVCVLCIHIAYYSYFCCVTDKEMKRRQGKRILHKAMRIISNYHLCYNCDVRPSRVHLTYRLDYDKYAKS